MPRDRYEPLKLNQTNRYPGYQFHTRVRIDGMEPSDAFVYLILSVYRWIRSKVPEADREVAELSLPEPDEYASADKDSFLPYHFSVGYALDITPLMEDGIWALRLKEPDSGSTEREAVPGRMFTTRVGLRLSDKGYTELGIRIDVTDPASVEKEIDYAFRPGFVRSLIIQPSVCFEHVREMKYGQPERINTNEDYKRLLFMLDNEDNQLPLVVFTHYRQEEKKAPSVSMEEFMKSEPVKSFLQSPLMGFGMSGKKDTSVPGMPSVSGLPSLKPGVVMIPDKPVKATGDAFGAAAAEVSAPAPVPQLLHDADAFARSAFGYALTVVLGDAFLDKFSSRVKKAIRPGDIVLCGARKFRGEVSVAGAFTGTGEERLKKAYSAALLAAQSYSKHKAPYGFGTVVFEAEARKLAQQKELQEILESGKLEKEERYERLVGHAEELNTVINNKDEKIARLERQCSEEFDRGVAFRDAENMKLEEENNNLRIELADEQEKNRQMLNEYQRAKDIRDALEQMRRVENLPKDNADVVRYFRQVYPDRLGFTERGEWEASRCGLRADHLWEILYMLANDLTDLFRSVQGNLKEEDVMQVTGCEISFKEGSETRKNNTLMKLRDDEYEGKAISVEPHLKLKSMKGEPAHQRLHFCYDPELKKIIVGYLGDHLDSAATKYAKKR